jgi:hypothetical protein
LARPLGHHQLTVLSALARLNGGTWSADCAWYLHSAAYTVRVLNTLVQRGYATRTSATARYAITEQGLNVLGWYTCGGCTRLTRSPVIEQPSSSRRRVRCSWCHTADAPAPVGASAPARMRPQAAPARGVPA